MSWLSAILINQKRDEEALMVSQRQRALVEAHFGKHHRLYASALDALAAILSDRGRNQDALDLEQKACASVEQLVGSVHPQLALCLNNVAAYLANLGEHEASVKEKERALRLFSQLPGHPAHVAMTQRNLANSLISLGRLDEAKLHLVAAAELHPSPSDEITILRLRGELARKEHHLADALAAHTEALALAERASARLTAKQLDARVALAKTQLALGRFEDAANTAQRAVTQAGEVYANAYGRESFHLAEPLRVEAEAELDAGHAKEARPLAEHAVTLLEQAQIDPTIRARAQLCVARALWSDTTQRARASALVAEARRASDAAGYDRELAEELGRFARRSGQ
jgi:tetratricopeptide (TPR) repeat protein